MPLEGGEHCVQQECIKGSEGMLFLIIMTLLVVRYPGIYCLPSTRTSLIVCEELKYSRLFYFISLLVQDDELESTIKSILKKSDLDSVSVKAVLRQVSGVTSLTCSPSLIL